MWPPNLAGGSTSNKNTEVKYECHSSDSDTACGTVLPERDQEVTGLVNETPHRLGGRDGVGPVRWLGGKAFGISLGFKNVKTCVELCIYGL